jgi:hypothetical protein
MASDDPLASLPPISSHPREKSSDSDSTSYTALRLSASSIILANDVDVVTPILDNYQPIHSSDDTSNVLRAFVDNLSGEGLSTLLTDIYSNRTAPHQLRCLRNFLVGATLKPSMFGILPISSAIILIIVQLVVKCLGGQQPRTTASPNEYAEHAIETAMSQIESSKRTGSFGTPKKDCLRRDNNRCVISSAIERTVFSSIPTSDRKGAKHTSTACAYILPFSLRQFEEKDATQTRNKSAILWALEEYFPVLKGKIRTDTINQPANA